MGGREREQMQYRANCNEEEGRPILATNSPPQQVVQQQLVGRKREGESSKQVRVVYLGGTTRAQKKSDRNWSGRIREVLEGATTVTGSNNNFNIVMIF